MRRLEDRLRVLSEAQRAFAEATVDYGRLLEVVARRLAEVVEDGCVVRLLAHDGWLLAPVAAHLPLEDRGLEPDELAQIQAHIRAPHNIAEQSAAKRVIETGEALLVPEIDLEGMRESTSPEIVRVFERIGIHSVLMVALRTGGRSIGLLSLVRFAPGSRAFNEEDRELAQTLADHAALAITNARLFDRARTELAERERLTSELEKAVRARDLFLSIASHELKTPLTALQLQLQQLERRLAKAAASDQMLGRCLQQTSRLSALVDDMLDVSRIGGPQFAVRRERVDLGELVNDVLTRFRPVADRARCELKLVAQPEVYVDADPQRIEQALVSMLSNAVKFGPGKPIHLQVDAGAETASISVRDHGFGISPSDQQRIFEPFERAVSERNYGGLGLGLYIARRVVEALGGSIAVESRPGEGALFTIELPRSLRIARSQPASG
jgi:signal transduction histidine kinase